MPSNKGQFTRRRFICDVGSGAVVLGSALISPALFADAASSIGDVKPLLLNYNENSLGMSARAVKAAQKATQSYGNRYPDDAVAMLRQTIALAHQVDTGQVIFGNGSTEVIQAIVTLAANRGATLIEPSPTFGDARRYASAENMKVVKIPVGKGFITDIKALRGAAESIDGPVLVNICNPNNPTGSIVNSNHLVDWINEAPADTLFLIDEAYFEYAQSNPAYASVLPQIQAGRENLVLTRTFSKIYGMAGMRIGYGIAAPKTAKAVRKFAAGYNLSAAGTAAALASLADDEFYNSSLQSNHQAKSILLNSLQQLDLAYIPSNTNFVLHRIGGSLANYSARMRDANIRVGRRMTKQDGWNRVSIGTPPEMQRFANTLQQFRKKGWV